MLVVDDNADMRDYLTRVLAPHWTVETAADGEIALAAAQSRRPDVILTDVMMPNLDGFGLVARLRQTEDTADIPVIMLSARAGRNRGSRGSRPARTTTSIKPFSARELLARVQVHLTLAQLRRKLLERAVEARRAAEDATRAKDEFLAMLGHELRNPLSPIVTAMRLLKLRGVDGKEIQIIERQLRQLVRLVDDLLDVSRITRGKIELHEERVTLADVVTRAHRDDESVARAATAPARRERSGRRSWCTATRPSRAGLRQSADERVEVQRSGQPRSACRRRPSGSGWRSASRIAASASDADLLERVFDLFVQQPQSLDRSAGGLGLGLAIVQNLVKAHGGSVRAESAGLGAGSEFVVDLPLAFGDAGAAAAARRRRPTSAPHGADRRTGSSSSTTTKTRAEMLAHTLAAMGHRVQVAFDGKTALDVAANFHPEVALLDIGLPVMDGYELASRLREMPGGADIRLIAVTGYGQARDRAAAKQAGFSEHVVKPVDVSRLGDLISSQAHVA